MTRRKRRNRWLTLGFRSSKMRKVKSCWFLLPAREIKFKFLYRNLVRLTPKKSRHRTAWLTSPILFTTSIWMLNLMQSKRLCHLQWWLQRKWSRQLLKLIMKLSYLPETNQISKHMKNQTINQVEKGQILPAISLGNKLKNQTLRFRSRQKNLSHPRRFFCKGKELSTLKKPKMAKKSLFLNKLSRDLIKIRQLLNQTRDHSLPKPAKRKSTKNPTANK